ncbi:MAG: flavin reductase family protein [marine benthic group bacterium]|nr:flavin reductase family protein [Gemmatimonadota bacterium]
MSGARAGLVAMALGNPVRSEGLSARERYELLTSLVVPRPIGWLSTRGPDGVANLAPYSYFAALSASPMLVGVSIGHRSTGPKDSLVNIRAQGAFCVNVVDVDHLEAMNASSIDSGPGHDEFLHAGLKAVDSPLVDAPYVSGIRAVLHCRLHRELDIGAEANTLVVGLVVGTSVDDSLLRVEGTRYIRTESLRPVGRLWGPTYSLPGEIRALPRPRSSD